MSDPAKHVHDHGHEHGHDHAHGHHHQHGDDDPYYLDQLCMVGLSGAMGGICLSLYLFKQDMLNLLLDKFFNPFVLASGIVLLTLACLRGMCLWQQAKAEKQAGNNHEHHHHDHEDAHDHGHAHDHPHGHHHHHHDGHDHGHDHDHSWAPWRYVVLLVPVILFLLGLPNKGPSLGAPRTIDTQSEALHVAALVALYPDQYSQVTMAAVMSVDQEGDEVAGMTFRQLLSAADSAEQRAYLRDKVVTVQGLFKRGSQGPSVFHVVLFQRQCCTADAMQVSIPVKSREPITSINDEDWVTVKGKVQFGSHQGRPFLGLLVGSARRVTAEPYKGQNRFID